MKKIFLTVIAALALCGSSFAQETYEPYYTPNNALENWDCLLTYVQINGVFVENTDNWAAMELASFVGDDCRGNEFLVDETEMGDEHPACQLPVSYTDNGESVTYRMYDHSTGIEYEGTINIEYVTGDGDHYEIWFGEDPVIINYTPMSTTGIEKQIIGHNNGEGHWYLLSSPVGDVDPVNVHMITDPYVEQADEENFTYDLYYFDQEGDEEGKEWITYRGLADGFMMVGKGYLYANLNDTVLSFPGTAYTGEGTFDLEYSDANADANMHGWNLVGNPYNADATIDKDFLVMNENGTELMTGSGAIAPMEGAFVKATGENQTVTFTPGTGNKKAELALNLSNGRSVIDRAVVRFNEGGQLPKFQLNRNHTKVYIPVDNEDYALVRSEGMGELPVNFKAEKNGTYTFTLSSENVEFGYLHLIDNMNGNDVDMLATPSYTFDAQTTDYASRFRLVFATGSSEDSFAFISNGNLVISNEGDATLQVIDVTGRILSSKSINGCASVNMSAAPGVYMVRLINGDNVKVQKVVVK